MAEIDHRQFAEAFAERLQEIGYSLGRAAQKWPDTNKAMLSRATTGKPISAGNFLLLCQLAGLDPFDFLDTGKQRRVTMKTILNQAVTAAAKRETPDFASRAVPPLVAAGAPARSGLRSSTGRKSS